MEDNTAGRRGMNARELGVLLTAHSSKAPGGARVVGARLVSSWWERKERTGFPEPLPVAGVGKGRRYRWDPDVVLAWFLGWTPRKGGAPKGNRNAVRHGGFCGVRAAREAARNR